MAQRGSLIGQLLFLTFAELNWAATLWHITQSHIVSADELELYNYLSFEFFHFNGQTMPNRTVRTVAGSVFLWQMSFFWNGLVPTCVCVNNVLIVFHSTSWKAYFWALWVDKFMLIDYVLHFFMVQRTHKKRFPFIPLLLGLFGDCLLT